MWKNKHRFVMILLLCGLMTWPVYGSPVDALQDSINQLQQQQQQIESELNDIQQSNTQIQDNLNNTKQDSQQLQQQKEGLEKNIQELDAQMQEAVRQLNDIQSQKNANQQQLDQITQEKEQAQQHIDEQYGKMKRRIQYMYEQGNFEYVEMLLSAVDMNDFLNKTEFVSTIMQYDRQMLADFQQTKQTIADNEAIIEQDQAALSQLEEQANARKQELENLTAQKAAQMENFNQLLAANQALTDRYQQQLDEQNQIFQELERAAAANQTAQSETLAALSQAVSTAADADRGQAEQAAAQVWLQQKAAEEQQILLAQGYNLTVDPNTLFVWPCPEHYTITSEYGWRKHPIYGDLRFHNGIDVRAETGTSIIAAYKGTVIGAGYNTSMGNYVMIDHGSGLVSIYMHASFLCVNQGQMVETGQLIALAGSTGDSTGPHLHFTTRLDGNNVSPWNYVTLPQ